MLATNLGFSVIITNMPTRGLHRQRDYKMEFLHLLQRDFKNIKFIEGKINTWSPQTKEIYYGRPVSKYSLLHELGHALEGHITYKLDVELLKMEADAWQKAREIAKNYGLKIPQRYINNCMNTYKDWLLARSKCPDCNLVGLQSDKDLQYSCCNCFLNWSVPLETKCLVRRIKKNKQLSGVRAS